MTDRRRYDPFAPAPRSTAPNEGRHRAPDPSASLTGVMQPPAALLLPDDLDDITKPDLVALAERHGVASYGTKSDIATRIRALTDPDML
ncbi:MAG: hypothetical protein L0I24_08940 [Pseudonocardia sp.]|nr:hypothetical protein [Pseudonocardia sp.]